MTPRLLLQLAWLHHTEAERCLPDPYTYPREPEATPEAQEQAAWLRSLATAIFERAEALLPPGAETGTDAAFGEIDRAS